MKTRRILAASTAALLSFASVAVVASATDVEYDAEWTEIGDNTNISYKIAKADAKKLEGLTISAEAADISTKAKVLELDKDLKDKVAKNIADAAANETDGSPDPLAVAIDITVSPEDDEDYTDRTDFKLAAPIQINVTGLPMAVDKVYHIEGGKLVEIKVDKLTKKTETPDGETEAVTTYGIQFTSKSFSPFVIAKGAIKGATTLEDQGEEPADESGDSAATSDGTTSPDTGIALAIAPVVLAAGAVAVVALKKKH